MSLHAWDIPPREAIALQRELAGQVRCEPLSGQVRRVAGTDCAFVDGGKGILAVAVVWDAASGAVIDEALVRQACGYPYVPGLLSFREAPAILEALWRLSEPWDLLMCDGQGRAHPRRLGLASHVGLWLDRPTVGVAKSVLTGEFRPPGERRGSATRMLDKGEIIGKALRTRTGVRCVYVSAGHRVNLDEACRWTLRCAKRYRLPEPTRQGHLRVTRAKKKRRAT